MKFHLFEFLRNKPIDDFFVIADRKMDDEIADQFWFSISAFYKLYADKEYVDYFLFIL